MKIPVSFKASVAMLADAINGFEIVGYQNGPTRRAHLYLRHGDD